MRIFHLLLGIVPFLLNAAPAHADWVEASSDHFVIYGDQEPETIRAFANRLERFHAAMSHMFRTSGSKPSPSNRVTIFVLDDEEEVQRLSRLGNEYVQGFYRPRAGNSIAVVQKLSRPSYTYKLSSETLLLHEYAHHFLSGLTSRTYPRWFAEGFAEFFSGVKFLDDGGVSLGIPPAHRGNELLYAKKVPIRRFLDFDGGADDYKHGYNSFYGQSWVLFHYLQFDPERKGQLRQYESLLNEGVAAPDAASQAFGDLDRLDRDMQDYAQRRKLTIATIAPGALQMTPTVLRKLRPGEAAMMPVVIESRLGVTPEQGRSLVVKARAVAERFPDDPAVLAALAEAEFDAGFDDAAIAAADRAVALDAGNVNAHIQKGHALFQKAEAADASPGAWKDVRLQYLKANRAENDNPIPLVRFYLAYLQERQAPPKNAVDGLEWAMQLAPFDPSLRWLVAQQMVSEKRWPDAVAALAPLAYSPHPGEHTQQALALLKEVEAKAEAAPNAGSATAAGE
jgi:tetratricopeptide (TPR) repeat protein